MLAELMLSALLLLVTYWFIVTRRLSSAVSAYSVQSWLLGLVALALYVDTRLIGLLLFGLLIVSVKGILIPRLLRNRVAFALVAGRETSYYVRFPTALLIGAGLSLVGLLAATRLAFQPQLLPQSVLGISLAVFLLGLFTTIARRDAILQVTGLLAAENGLLLLSLVVAPGLSLLIEVAIVLDVLIAVLVMGFLVARMRDAVAGTDTSELTRLRG
jgi:hydrogenase-4 component E